MLLENTLFPFLAEPLPGEILSSVIIRSALMIGKTPDLYLQSLTGKKLNNLLYYFFLDHFTDLENVLDLTVYPYFFSVLNEEQCEQTIRSLRSGKLVGRNELPNYPLKGLRKKNLYYCPECLKEDLKKFGTGYFHLNHQYDGVTCCTKHQLKLIPCLRDQSRTILGSEDIIKGIPANDLEIEEAEILTTLSKMRLEDLQDIYNACIDNMDDAPSQNKKKIIENADRINLNFPVTLSAEHVNYLLKGNKSKAYHPYFHVAMIKALALETGSVEAVFKKPSITCRNPHCRSENTRLMGINLPRSNYWQCQVCGCVFSDTRITQLGKHGKELLEEHEKESPKAYLDNIEGLNIKRETYKKLMDSDPEAIDKRISFNRSKARKFTSYADLRKDCPSAYNFLRKYDYKWLGRLIPTSPGPVSTQAKRKAQEEQDEKALKKVKKVYKKFQKENVWITANFLKTEAGLKRSDTYLRKYYPKTIEFIKAHAETCEASWIRRIKFFIDQYDFTKPLTLQVLKNEFGTSRFIPIVYRLLENYIREKERESYAF